LTPAGSAILTTGRRTVADLLRTAAPLAPAHPTTYLRVLSSASWPAMRLACALYRLVLALVPVDRPIPPVVDDTVESHPGRKVYGKARHRDPVRSSHGHTVWPRRRLEKKLTGTAYHVGGAAGRRTLLISSRWRHGDAAPCTRRYRPNGRKR